MPRRLHGVVLGEPQGRDVDHVLGAAVCDADDLPVLSEGQLEVELVPIDGAVGEHRTAGKGVQPAAVLLRQLREEAAADRALLARRRQPEGPEEPGLEGHQPLKRLGVGLSDLEEVRWHHRGTVGEPRHDPLALLVDQFVERGVLLREALVARGVRQGVGVPDPFLVLVPQREDVFILLDQSRDQGELRVPKPHGLLIDIGVARRDRLGDLHEGTRLLHGRALQGRRGGRPPSAPLQGSPPGSPRSPTPPCRIRTEGRDRRRSEHAAHTLACNGTFLLLFWTCDCVSKLGIVCTYNVLAKSTDFEQHV